MRGSTGRRPRSPCLRPTTRATLALDARRAAPLLRLSRPIVLRVVLEPIGRAGLAADHDSAAIPCLRWPRARRNHGTERHCLGQCRPDGRGCQRRARAGRRGLGTAHERASRVRADAATRRPMRSGANRAGAGAQAVESQRGGARPSHTRGSALSASAGSSWADLRGLPPDRDRLLWHELREAWSASVLRPALRTVVWCMLLAVGKLKMGIPD